MKHYEATEVFTLRSLRDVMVFCRRLYGMKRDAPISLQLTVAVTAQRSVEFVGLEGGELPPDQDLQALDQELASSRNGSAPGGGQRSP